MRKKQKLDRKGVELLVSRLAYAREYEMALQLALALGYRVSGNEDAVQLNRWGDRLMAVYFQHDALIDDLLQEGRGVLNGFLRKFLVVYWVPGTRETAGCEWWASDAEVCGMLFAEQCPPYASSIVEIVEAPVGE